MASYAAARGSGPFSGTDLFAEMVTLQAFNGVATLTALLTAAVIAERNQAHEQLQQAATALAAGVDRLEQHRTHDRENVQRRRASRPPTNRTLSCLREKPCGAQESPHDQLPVSLF
jgi:hypothetical protein